jgi:GNAT superfamily N-acetyltransferase
MRVTYGSDEGAETWMVIGFEFELGPYVSALDVRLECINENGWLNVDHARHFEIVDPRLPPGLEFRLRGDGSASLASAIVFQSDYFLDRLSDREPHAVREAVLLFRSLEAWEKQLGPYSPGAPPPNPAPPAAKADALRIEVTPATAEGLRQYGAIRSWFWANSELRFEPINEGLGWHATEVAVAPYLKDYDAAEGPERWAALDVASWSVVSAYDQTDTLVGSAIMATCTEGIHLFEGRRELALLWDIRVAEQARGQGVGHRLFREVAELARSWGCTQLKVETQNNNVAACRFYARQGCQVRAINHGVYGGAQADEVQVLFFLDLVPLW